MMNRSTQRELIKLLLQFSETLPQIDFGADEQKNMALDILETVAGKCRQDFSKAKADEYIDTMQALSQIIQTTDWHQQGRAENIQCNTLCQDIILQLVENLRHEKEIKKDIVFLPYKASMWDSLESVWKAAYEDKEHCNAYVIPIPYADLNPDRSVAAWHCERDQYPKYVPTLDWREIDLEKWHPDIIFIHNPYDNYNYITSVESRYYAQNLKHCTNKLVYIPYFVLEEPCMEESVEHFVMTAGVLNADKIIVQSEAMRELYINILTKKTEHTDRVYWEKRISGAGSPKIEKVLTSKKEDFEMPAKWRKLVEGKKVILYNTILSAMLQNSDKVCDKLRYVFDVFRNRNDVVLWWRPHPLMKSTFHSMRPQYEAEYLSLENQYIEEGWGIYDDSSDLHRAICWSDAYYGDGSSVITLYRKTDKPIFIQNLQGKIELNFKHHFEYLFVENEKVWGLSQGGFIGLYEANLQTEKIKCLGEVPIKNRQPLNRDYEYAVLEKMDNKIVIAPYFSRDGLIVYDIPKQKFYHILIASDKFPDDDAESAFVYSFSFKKHIFFLGNRTGIILEYLPKENVIIYHNKWSEQIKKLIGKSQILFERQGYVKKEKFLYMIVSRTNIMVKLDLSTMESLIYKIPYNFHAINLCYDDDFFWIIPFEGEYILRWDEINNRYKKIKAPRYLVWV